MQEGQKVINEGEMCEYTSEELPNYPTEALVDQAIQDLGIYTKDYQAIEASRFTQPIEKATFLVKGLSTEERIKLTHLGYLVIEPSSLKLWKESSGLMRGSVYAVNSRGRFILHGKNETYQDIMDRMANIDVEEKRYLDKEITSVNPENVYSVKGTSDNLWVISSKVNAAS